ncbi:MAG TPA: BON domain-containing protein [Kofleriaceae bacterium]|jgi:osmotically-inducible protein OsmY
MHRAARMANNGQGRTQHDDNRNNRDRMFDDRDEGNRHGDRSFDRTTDRGGMGQSGYGSGRDVRDASPGTWNRNQSVGDRSMNNNQDDRFSGRGGDDYQRDGGRDRSGYRSAGAQSYANDEQNDRGWGGSSMHGDYGQSESERGVWQGDMRGTQRGSNRQSTGGYGSSNDHMDRGYGQSGYNQNYGYNRGQGGTNQNYGNQNFGASGVDYGRDDHGFGAMGGQSYGGNYGGQQGYRGSSYGQRGESRPFGQNANPMGLHRGKGPQGWTRSDERIKDQVCEALTDHEHIDASGIDVEVKNGDVTLSGMVPDRDTKRAAEDCAERIAGVKDVTNQLKVSSDERMRIGQSSQGKDRTHGNGASMTSNGGIENGSSSKDKKAQA